MTLRIAQVVCTDAFAGAERYVATLSHELDSLGMEVHAIGGDPAAMGRALAGTGVVWHRGATVGEAMQSLSRVRPDVVNAHMTQAEFAAVGATALRRTPIVATRHFAQPRGSSRAARLAARAVSKRIGAQISISRFVADRVGDPTEVILSGVPTAADTPGAADREPVVLVAQRLAAEKQTSVVLEAWAAAGIRHAGWRLWLAGTGPLSAEARALAARLGIADSVDFLGRRDDVPDLMRRASMLLATAPAEPLGLTVLEAMSHALPVVATGAGGHVETLGGAGDRWFFAPGDAPRAARLLDALAADVDERDRWGRALQRRQREAFTVRRQAEQTLTVYRRTVSS